MNSLREIVDFVGIPQGSAEVARFRNAQEQLKTSLGLVNILLTRREKPASMRAIIQTLENLTPITLEAKIATKKIDDSNVLVTISWNESGEITWYTDIEQSTDGGSFRVVEGVQHRPNESEFGVGPGTHHYVVHRAGISNTGFVNLKKDLGSITVPEARPEPPPPPTPEKPSISVKSNGDGSFEVSGSKFLPNKTVYIRVVDQAQNENSFQVTSDSQGMFEGFPTGDICQRRGVLVFTANDGRSDSNITGTLSSNPVRISCPG